MHTYCISYYVGNFQHSYLVGAYNECEVLANEIMSKSEKEKQEIHHIKIKRCRR